VHIYINTSISRRVRFGSHLPSNTSRPEAHPG
jgi:hypothetical protein